MSVRLLLWFGLALLLTACQPQRAPTTGGPVPPPPGPSYTAPGPLPIPRSSMTRVQAAAGQTCVQYYGWCDEWCKKNAAGNRDCSQWCVAESGRCERSGEWTIENERKIVIGLPPK